MTSIHNFSRLSALLASNDGLIDKIVNDLGVRMLDDYRINRFFNSGSAMDQAQALLTLIRALAVKAPSNAEALEEICNDYFMAAFARSNAKPSLVNGNDFAFLLDIVGGREIREIMPLCESHAWLIKLGPDDFHYDVIMEHLAFSLQALGVAADVKQEIMAFAESGRDPVLARGQVMLQAA